MASPLHPELEAAKGRTLAFAEKQLSALFAGADEYLLSPGSGAAGQAAQAAGFDASSLLRGKKDALRRAFAAEFEAAFAKQLGTPQEAAPAASFGLSALKLVDEGEMEETLAVTSIAEKAGKVCGEGIFALAQRFNELVPDAQFSDQNLPLAPKVLGEAFRKALDGIAGDASAATKLAIIKLFDKHVMQALGELYDVVNDALAQAGVLPEIRVKVRKQPDSGATTPRLAPQDESAAAPASDGLGEVVTAAEESVPQAPPRPDESGPGSGEDQAATQPDETAAAPAAPVPVDQSTFGTLSALLSQQRAQVAGAAGEAAPPAVLGEALALGAALPPAEATRQLVNSVSALQTTMQSMAQLGAIAAEGGSLATALARVLKDQEQSVPLSAVDAGTIDILGLMFEVILDDSNIPGSLRALVSKLQLPYLKVALLDKEFFNQTDHPARRLLNELGHAGLGWREVEDPQQDPFYRKVAEIVEAIGEKFTDDVGIFQTLLDDFLAFMSEEDAYGAAREILIERVKTDVQDLVRQKLGKQQLPVCARELILGPWRELLQQIHARKGADSEEWQQAVSVLEALVWSLQPKPDPETRARLAKMLPKLLKALRSGLDAIGHDPAKSDEMLRALQPLHMATLHGKTAVSAETPASEGRDPAQAPESDEATQREQVELEAATEAVKALAAGDWVEFCSVDGKSMRGKLIWHSEVLDDYTFVSRMYKVVAERNSAQLIREFLAGLARRLENVPLIDRALDAVMRRLRGA